jgi:hypothetical protein
LAHPASEPETDAAGPGVRQLVDEGARGSAGGQSAVDNWSDGSATSVRAVERSRRSGVEPVSVFVADHDVVLGLSARPSGESRAQRHDHEGGKHNVMITKAGE